MVQHLACASCSTACRNGALRWGHWLSSLLALAAFVALAHTAGEATVANAWLRFTCALLVWGAGTKLGVFFSGWVTGPRKTALAWFLA